MNNATPAAADYSALDDGELVRLVRCGDRFAFRQITQRCNQRIFRVVRSVIRDEAEAEDVVQEAYLQAYRKIDSFRGESALSTWLARIALNEAYARLRSRHATLELDAMDPDHGDTTLIHFPTRQRGEDPAKVAARGQLRDLLERAVDQLPDAFRTVYVMRDIEGCSVRETAEALDLREETVKTRLHRARRRLRAELHDQITTAIDGAFEFLGQRCERMTDRVMARIESLDEVT
ncbi:MAG: RNA polymerase sigma factor [Xanthomonadales bacterium]|nr:RNA polymerase sigma factor [Xanthomonadales bacterium]